MTEKLTEIVALLQILLSLVMTQGQTLATNNNNGALLGSTSVVTATTTAWTQIAKEGQRFTVSGTQTVRYGYGTSWVQKTVTNSGTCSNRFFGKDPIVNQVKVCQVSSTVTPSTPTPVTIATPFKIGDRVSMTANVNVRTSGLISATTLIGVNPLGSVGTLIAGPTRSADGLVWFNVNFDAGFDGWVGSNNYRLVTTSVTPLPTPAPTPTFTTTVSGLTATAAFTLSNGCEGYTILWGDGTQSAKAASPSGSSCTMAIVNVSQVHAYATAGTYTVTVQRYSSGTTLKDTSTRTVTVAGSTPAPTPLPVTINTPFKINDRVSMTANVNVRSTGLVSATTLLGVNPLGSMGTLVAGPTQSADGLIWFNVNFDTGFDGWVGANNYRLVTTVTPLPSPTPTPIPVPAPTLVVNANPTSVTTGNTAVISWSSTNATACTASGAWSGSRAVTGSFTTSALNTTGTQTYSMTCTGSGGSVTRSGSVAVTAAATVTPTPAPTTPTVFGPRTPSPLSVRQIHSGHSLTDGGTFQGTYPGHFRNMINSIQANSANVAQSTIPGSPLHWRWNNVPGYGQPDARGDIGNYQLLVITEGVPFIFSASNPEWTLEHRTWLRTWAEHAWRNGNGGAGAPTILYATWTNIDDADGPFRQNLDTYQPIWEDMADYASANLPAQAKVYIIPANLLMKRFYDDIQAGRVPGINNISGFFSDAIHPNGLGSYAVALQHLLVIHHIDPRGLRSTGFGLSPEPSAALAKYIQDTVWDVTTKYPRSGVTAGNTTTSTQTPSTVPTPTLSLSANPTSLTAGNAATLNWSSTNATACSAGGAWSGSRAVNGSFTTGALSTVGTQIFNLTCTGSGGSVSRSASVGVTASTVTSAPTVTSCTVPTLTFNPADFDRVIDGTEITSTLTLDGSAWNNTLIRNCRVRNTAGDGILLRNVSNVVITGCTFENMGGNAAVRGSSSGGTSNVTLYRNTVNGTASNGFHFAERIASGVDHVNLRIIGNTLSNTGRASSDGSTHALYIQAHDSLITHNTINGSRNGNGISVRSSGEVSCNTVSGTSSNGKPGIRYYSDHNTGLTNTLIINRNTVSGATEGINIYQPVVRYDGQTGLDHVVKNFVITNNDVRNNTNGIGIASQYNQSPFTVTQSGNMTN
ncbi:MAG: right-handed parallel beta-helix repeat-containing protein [Patescibacteria group bacterium]